MLQCKYYTLIIGMIINVWIQPKLKSQWKFIMDTLNAPRGWRRFYPDLLFKQISQQRRADLYIRIKDKPFYRSGDNPVNQFLNAYAPKKRTIYINALVWHNHTPFLKNRGVPLLAYRTYIINHEVGHHLGKGHLNEARLKWAPVMMQQTLGTFGSQYFNPYPTRVDMYA